MTRCRSSRARRREALDLLEARARPALGQLAERALEAERQSRDRLAGLVVQLARDAHALVLLGVEEALEQLGAPLVAVAQLARRAAGAPRCARRRAPRAARSRRGSRRATRRGATRIVSSERPSRPTSSSGSGGNGPLEVAARDALGGAREDEERPQHAARRAPREEGREREKDGRQGEHPPAERVSRVANASAARSRTTTPHGNEAKGRERDDVVSARPANGRWSREERPEERRGRRAASARVPCPSSRRPRPRRRRDRSRDSRRSARPAGGSRRPAAPDRGSRRRCPSSSRRDPRAERRERGAARRSGASSAPTPRGGRSRSPPGPPAWR